MLTGAIREPKRARTSAPVPLYGAPVGSPPTVTPMRGGGPAAIPFGYGIHPLSQQTFITPNPLPYGITGVEQTERACAPQTSSMTIAPQTPDYFHEIVVDGSLLFAYTGPGAASSAKHRLVQAYPLEVVNFFCAQLAIDRVLRPDRESAYEAFGATSVRELMEKWHYLGIPWQMHPTGGAAAKKDPYGARRGLPNREMLLKGGEHIPTRNIWGEIQYGDRLMLNVMKIPLLLLGTHPHPFAPDAGGGMSLMDRKFADATAIQIMPMTYTKNGMAMRSGCTLFDPDMLAGEDPNWMQHCAWGIEKGAQQICVGIVSEENPAASTSKDIGLFRVHGTMKKMPMVGIQGRIA